MAACSFAATLAPGVGRVDMGVAIAASARAIERPERGAVRARCRGTSARPSPRCKPRSRPFAPMRVVVRQLSAGSAGTRGALALWTGLIAGASAQHADQKPVCQPHHPHRPPPSVHHPADTRPCSRAKHSLGQTLTVSPRIVRVRVITTTPSLTNHRVRSPRPRSRPRTHGNHGPHRGDDRRPHSREPQAGQGRG